VPGDIVFAIGALVLAWYALRLLRRPKAQQTEPLPASVRATR
jgi:nitric oxide reductase subunit B